MECLHRVKDQPVFEVDDTTTSFSPPRAPRPRWVERGRPSSAQGGAAQVTAQHWYEPAASAAQQPSAPMERPDRSGRRALIAGAVVVALTSAVMASIGTLALLVAGGWLAEPAPTQASVVVVTSPRPIESRSVDRPDAWRLAEGVGPAIVTIVVAPAPDSTRSATSLDTTVIASGVVFDKGGWVITNRHVVCGADTIAVVLSDGRRLAGELYGLDSLTDLAIVRVAATDLQAADIGDSSSLRPGQMSVVVGSSADTDTATVTSGLVRALGRDLIVADRCTEGARRALRNVIQMDATVGDRSSGGALLDATGSVVGINTTVTGESGRAAYAIPVNIAKPIMDQATAEKPITRPWMGITYTALNRDIAATHGLAIDHGAWLRGATDGSVPAVVPGGPADIAGLQEGDVLTAIDDQRIDSAHPLDDILSQYRPESQDPIVVSVLRDGAPMELPLMLGSRSEPT
jgi:S1-C subfamily serine protease